MPWTDIARPRDLLTHHYHRVDATILRATIDAPLAELNAAADRLRVGLEADGNTTEPALGAIRMLVVVTTSGGGVDDCSTR